MLQYAVRVIFCLRNFFVFFYPFDCELICVICGEERAIKKAAFHRKQPILFL
ncbi:hypothetical protein HMPREF2532_03339 [Bacteroides ovatus]|nr:hypothetical protein HMPREF2532_03339 [Bacteroides ovatus]